VRNVRVEEKRLKTKEREKKETKKQKREKRRRRGGRGEIRRSKFVESEGYNEVWKVFKKKNDDHLGT
jgi:hypothetical protein